MMAVYLLATLDTKGPEGEFLRSRLVELGLDVVVLDCGCSGETGDRGQAVNASAERNAKIVADAYQAGKV